MKKFLYELGAALTVAMLIVPVGIFAASVAFVEALKLFPSQIFKLFENWYKEQ